MARVAPALAPYVASLVAYDVDLGAPGVHRGLPSTTITVVLPVGDPLDVGWRDVAGSRSARWSTVSGLHAHPAEIHHDGTQVGVQLALTIAGVRALFGVSAAELAGELVELGDVVAALRHLPELLAACTPEERERRVQQALLRRLADIGAPRQRAEVGHALARLTRGAAVQEVADEVGYSRRHLGNLVRHECGMSPQEIRRIGRFEASRAQVGRRPLAAVAHACGYADQAHLTRDWVALAGCSPTTWVREEFPFLQDLTGADESE